MHNHWVVSRRTLRSVPGPVAARGELDRIFDALWLGLGGAPRTGDAPAFELVETGSGFRVVAELPGLGEPELEVSVEGRVLTVRGERAEEQHPAVRRVERFRGKFQHSLRLPAEIDSDAVRAVYRNGILTVTLPKAAAPAARSIPVTAPEKPPKDERTRDRETVGKR